MRLKILVSTIPLILAGFAAGGQWTGKTRPCISVGETSVQIAYAPWQRQQRVSFTTDPSAATVRVQIVDSAEIADFAVIDDIDTAEAESCGIAGTIEYVTIAANPAANPAAKDPVIYLSRDSGADYRIFVASKNFTATEAAALMVAANRGHAPINAASL